MWRTAVIAVVAFALAFGVTRALGGEEAPEAAAPAGAVEPVAERTATVRAPGGAAPIPGMRRGEAVVIGSGGGGGGTAPAPSAEVGGEASAPDSTGTPAQSDPTPSGPGPGPSDPTPPPPDPDPLPPPPD